MNCGTSICRGGWPVVLALAVCVSWAVCVPLAEAVEPGVVPPEPAHGGQTIATNGGNSLGQIPLRVAERTNLVGQMGSSQPNEHPLTPCLRWAKSGISEIEKIQDYSATLVKRERISGKLGDYEYMFVKIRHRPFSVYIYFLGPSAVRGREVVYVQGRNDGKMQAHDVGMRETLFGTVSLKPDGLIAMQGQRYPLTEMGLLNLVRRLSEVAEKDMRYGECEVKFFQGAKINDRVCTCLQVVHPTPRRNFLFHVARIFVDDELNLPVRYEAYDWPHERGAAPEVMEEYTYVNLKLNNGFSDEDFDAHNPKYHFYR